MSSLRVSTATPSDLNLVLDIVDEAARWLSSRGIHRWESPLPPPVRSLLEGAIIRREVFLVSLPESPEVIGSFRLDWRHAPFWPDQKDAGYLYTMALRPEFIGQGLGRDIIAWVSEQTRARRRNWLRLDAIAANPRLRRCTRTSALSFAEPRLSGDMSSPFMNSIFSADWRYGRRLRRPRPIGMLRCGRRCSSS